MLFCSSKLFHFVASSYLELFWSSFSRIRMEYGEILPISPYSVRMRENMDQNYCEYGHFSRSFTFTTKGKTHFTGCCMFIILWQAQEFLVFLLSCNILLLLFSYGIVYVNCASTFAIVRFFNPLILYLVSSFSPSNFINIEIKKFDSVHWLSYMDHLDYSSWYLHISFNVNISKTHLEEISQQSPYFPRLRSSFSEIFFKIGVLKNFAKFIGKHLCWRLFIIKLQACRPATL